MYINKSQIVITILVLLTLLAAVVNAQDRNNESAVTPTLLQYQGRLSDPASGESMPDGSYTMVFRLYETSSGGAPLWTETKDVPVQDGLFSTVLGSTTALDIGKFHGQPLWLGIKVGTDEETQPRQQVMPVAYALSLVPGASIVGDSSSPALSVANAGSGAALNVDGDLSVSGSLVGGQHGHANYVDWYSFDTTVAGFIDSGTFDSHIGNASAHHQPYTDAKAVNAAANSNLFVNSSLMDTHITNAGAHHQRYTNTEAVNAIKANDGSGSGLDADLLDGQQASAFASAGHGHDLLPIAYGTIRADGTVLSSTGNVTSRWNQGSYEISIDGHYITDSYVTVITPADFLIPYWNSINGKMVVILVPGWDPLSVYQEKFHFVTYKP